MITQALAAPPKAEASSHQETKATVAAPSPVRSIPPYVQPFGWGVLTVFVFAGLVFYVRRIRKFAREYAGLSARMDSHFGSRPGSALSPGYTYTVASRGPNHARDAEMQSAEARWRQVSMAFPHLDDRAGQRPLILVSTKYTKLKEVADMQSWLGTRISSHVVSRHREILRPAWIQDLGEDFDALRHPQLAIANPAIYTFPFFLTWQRRHQWGVLPYAVHNRLGVICHPDHPGRDTLRKIEEAYIEDLKRARDEQSALWVNDPKYALWLPLLLKTAGTTPVTLSHAAGAPP